MSQTIWMQCGGAANIQSLSCTAWRAIEAQHVLTTLSLVDSDKEQVLLEELIDRAKPPRPQGPEFEGLNYLLWTPFRYRPHGNGSRFGRNTDRNIWYGAESVRTCLAEKAYHKILFLEATDASIHTIQADHTAFPVDIDTARGVDLCGAAFSCFHADLFSPTDHACGQAMGDDLRSSGVEAVRYQSARDPAKGASLGVLSPLAFAQSEPNLTLQETWKCAATREVVEFVHMQGVTQLDRVRFSRTDFMVDGKLPKP